MDNRTEPKEASLLVRGPSRHRIVGAITASCILDKGKKENTNLFFVFQTQLGYVTRE